MFVYIYEKKKRSKTTPTRNIQNYYLSTAGSPVYHINASTLIEQKSQVVFSVFGIASSDDIKYSISSILCMFYLFCCLVVWLFDFIEIDILSICNPIIFCIFTLPERIIRFMIDMRDKTTYAWNAVANYRTATGYQPAIQLTNQTTN